MQNKSTVKIPLDIQVSCHCADIETLIMGIYYVDYIKSAVQKALREKDAATCSDFMLTKTKKLHETLEEIIKVTVIELSFTLNKNIKEIETEAVANAGKFIKSSHLFDQTISKQIISHVLASCECILRRVIKGLVITEQATEAELANYSQEIKEAIATLHSYQVMLLSSQG